jgi:Domain of unknown function (DUF4278)
MQLAYRGCSYYPVPPSARILRLFTVKNLRKGMYRGVPYQFYRIPEVPFKEKFQIKYRGNVVRTEAINFNRDLTVAKIQIQNQLSELTQSGLSNDEAIDTVAGQIIEIVRLNPQKKQNLVSWGQTMGKVELTDSVKKTVNRAMVAAYK